MDKYKRYFGVIIFVILIGLILMFVGTKIIAKYATMNQLKADVDQISQTLEQQKRLQMTVQAKIKKLKASVMGSQKKIYTPIEDFGNDQNDTLFFTLYNDVIEMVKANSIKIKSIDYQYNPEGDLFVEQGTTYFVCDVNMEIVSNYVNLGKLIQDLYQYPYYIKINKIEVIPYPKDKKILLSTISLRLYAHTSPDSAPNSGAASANEAGGVTIDGASAPLPQ